MTLAYIIQWREGQLTMHHVGAVFAFLAMLIVLWKVS